MTEERREIAKMCIRGDLNLMFTISRSIATILDLAETLPLARNTLISLSESLLYQAADVHGRMLRDYGDSSPDAEGEYVLPAEIGS